MATAKQVGGLYLVNGRMVDAEGQEVKGADMPGPDTQANEQPGAIGSTSTPEERMATAIASALKPAASASRPAAAESEPAAPKRKRGKK